MAFVHPAPQTDDLLKRIDSDGVLEAIRHPYRPDSRGIGEWIHWDKLRHLEPPEPLSHEQWWLGIKIARDPLLRPFPLLDPVGRTFSYAMPDEVLRALHEIDQHAAGEIAMPELVVSDDQARQHYLVNTLMEESIRSSQLEGAATSRRRAAEMLRSGRAPTDRSEQMILNNYRAMEFVRSVDGDLEPAMVLELHRILTDGTLEDPLAAGRLQRADDDRVVVYDQDGSLIHTPPPAQQLPDRLQALCAFANGEGDPDMFMHPVIRAILVHFWLAFDHPFEDGNGRTARTLFYWTMRREGYWLTEYLSISRILRTAPSQYSKAFVLSETDGGDATYFLVYQLDVILRAIGEFRDYLSRKVREIDEVERRLRQTGDLNHRQLALLGDALRTPERRYTYASHAASHGVTHETARSDLMQLAERGFVRRSRSGRRHVFAPSPGIAERVPSPATTTVD